jgi:hypothetical protein
MGSWGGVHKFCKLLSIKCALAGSSFRVRVVVLGFVVVFGVVLGVVALELYLSDGELQVSVLGK